MQSSQWRINTSGAEKYGENQETVLFWELGVQNGEGQGDGEITTPELLLGLASWSLSSGHTLSNVEVTGSLDKDNSSRLVGCMGSLVGSRENEEKQAIGKE